jgi:hypothetical protein
MGRQPQCPACGGGLLQKNRLKLISVGLAMLVAAVSIYRVSHALAVLAILLVLTGAYLVAWGSLGEGLWCRHCKRFPVS